MIRARHTFTGTLFFRYYSEIQLHRNFRNLRIIGDFYDRKLPVLILGNHFSWWDGFIQLYLNTHRIKRKFHVMMLEEQLRKHMILNKGGAFSVKKGTRNISESLAYCHEILESPENLLVFFPQGKIQSSYTFPLQFERGIEPILSKLKTPVHLLFNVNLTDYFSNKKPVLSIYFREYSLSGKFTLKALEDAYNHFVGECIKNQTES